MIKSCAISALLLASSSCFAQVDVVALDQVMEAKLSKLHDTAVQYECKVKMKRVVPEAKIEEKFPDGTVSFTAPYMAALGDENTTKPLVTYGAYLTDDGRVYQKSDLVLKVTQHGNRSLVATTIVGREGVKTTTHWLTDGSGSKVLIERFAEDGVQRNGNEKSTASPRPYSPRFQRAYELADPKKLQPETESLSETSLKVVYTDEKGSTEYLVDTARNFVTKKVDNNGKRTLEVSLGEFAEVADFNLPGNMTEKEIDTTGKFLNETVINDWKFKVLSDDEARMALKLDFPEGTTMGQRGLKAPVPGF